MEEIQGPGYRIRVAPGVSPPSWDPEERVLTVGLTVLEFDARLGILGETVAGLLLPPLTHIPERLARIIDDYRARIVAEQAADLGQRIGGVAGLARVRPSYFPVSRAVMLWKSIGCLLHGGLDPDRLDDEYSPYSWAAGDEAGGYVRIRPARFKKVITANLSRLRLMTSAALASISKQLSTAWPGVACGSLPEKPDPSGLVLLPEGAYHYDCPGGEDLAARLLGPGTRCKVPQWTSSTLVCQGPTGERVAVKEYLRMIVKWLPASIASASKYGYVIGPKTRLYNEYRYLRFLRGVVRTPGILAVCGDQVRALMAREYLEGTPVLGSQDPGHWALSGEALARIHKSGTVLGDPNPGNFVVEGSSVGIVDAEQAKKYTVRRGAWDLAVYVYYASLFGTPPELTAEGLRAYAGEAPDLWGEESRILSRKKYWAPFTVVPGALSRSLEALRLAGVQAT